MSGPLQIEHLELALDPETPFHLNFARAQGEVVALLTRAVRAVDPDAPTHGHGRPLPQHAASSDSSPAIALAVRAVLLCGHVQLRGTLAILNRAARSPRPALREAVAAALEFRGDDRPELLASLLDDPELTVKVRALAVLAHRPVRRRVRHLAALKRLRADPDPQVRNLARGVGVLRRGGVSAARRAPHRSRLFQRTM